MCLQLRVTTKVKLDLQDSEGNSLCYEEHEDTEEDEVHFVQLEAII